jgi:hypothetical protein
LVEEKKITKVHPPCALTEEGGSANHRSGPGVNVLAEGDADGNVVGDEGAIAARLRGANNKSPFSVRADKGGGLGKSSFGARSQRAGGGQCGR